jgi:hypothetical protein
MFRERCWCFGHVVPRGIRNGLRAERMFRPTRFNPRFVHQASLLEIHPSSASPLLFIPLSGPCSAQGIGRSHRWLGVRGPAGKTFQTCRRADVNSFISPFCSEATVHCIPTTRLSELQVAVITLLYTVITLYLCSCARILATQLTQPSCGGYAASTFLGSDLK